MRGHHGAVTVRSEVGVGTWFRVCFPISQRTATPARNAPPATWCGSGQVLLVDDEAAIRVAGARMLELLGFSALVAADGREAVEVFRQHGDGVRCVVLDLTMPRMDGEETFDELRRIRSDIAIIVSSGYTEQDVSSRFVGKRMSGFLQKPYSMETLTTVLRVVLENHPSVPLSC